MSQGRQSLRFSPQNKLAVHPQFSALVRGERVYPINVEISPSGLCQADCPFCFFATGALGAHRNVMLDHNRALELVKECSALGVKSISWSGGGEPSLHPEFDDIVEFTDECGLEQGIFTNALASPKYDPKLLAWIRVTITDKPIRPEYIKLLRPARTLGIAFNYRGPEDAKLLRDTLDIAQDCSVDYVQLRPALRFHGQTVDITPPLTIDHPLLHVTDYKFQEARHKHNYSRCEAYHLVPFIWETGNVDICSYMRLHPGYTLGNIYKNTLKEILDAAPVDVPVIDGCQVCCRNHEHNKSIHAARALQDVNFP